MIASLLSAQSPDALALQQHCSPTSPLHCYLSCQPQPLQLHRSVLERSLLYCSRDWNAHKLWDPYISLETDTHRT